MKGNDRFTEEYVNELIAEIKEKILNYSKNNKECEFGFQFPSRIPTFSVSPLTGEYKFKNDKLHVRFIRICDLEEFTVSRQAKLLHQAMKELLDSELMFRRYGDKKIKGYVYSHDKMRLGMIDCRLLGLALEYKNESLAMENNYCPVVDDKYGKSPASGTFKTYRQFNLLTKGDSNKND
jgi:hypothetical protein